MAPGPELTNAAPCCLRATNRNLRKLFTQFSNIPLLLFSLPFLESRHKIQRVLGGQSLEAGGHTMNKKISVKMTCVAMGCLVAACVAVSAQAQAVDMRGVPVAVSDALLASTRAANLQHSIVANVPGIAPVAIAPAHTVAQTANNVRLWDEVVPPAPLPKPTQASISLPNGPRMIAAISHVSPPALSAGMQPTRLSVNAGVGAMPPRPSR
ncbi:hypothetical protein OYT13_09000 [Pandoraea sp. XJJ-1]|uniref:hypothetical protein n=1 Tax=unclassified Pandoraea TaxID=2624094 RepID=UPI0012F8724F|nr:MULTISPECIES: hypothetical protein [unclassified Pandoraea]WAL84543.1 hypothetical protein OYT13_09000 [Pandoraea sp. XJJ-1]